MTTPAQLAARFVLIFDGRCGVCSRIVDWVRRHLSESVLLALPNQAPGVAERYGLTRDDVDQQAWLIEVSGRRWHGAAAVNKVLWEVGGRWRFVAAFYGVPGLNRLEETGYCWFAGHRGWFGRFGATPACERPGIDCTKRS